MNKLRQLEIIGFRGARFKLPIDLSQNNKSICVYGENAGGKSTITDAIEWYLLNRVGHLWLEDCKEEALRNVLLDSADACSVSIKFDDSSLDGTKSLSAGLKVSVTQQTANARTFLSAIQDERIFLRHAQITKFIGATKSAKREEIASIIGYEQITNFRDVLQTTIYTLRREGGYNSARHLAEAAKNKIFQLTNSVIANESDLFKKSTGLVAKFNVEISINDDATYDQVLEKLHSKVLKPENAQRKIKLDQFKNDCDELVKAFPGFAKAKEKFFEPYNKLAKNKAVVSPAQH